MKCIDGCGYNQKPDNLDTLARHIEECLVDGVCQKLKKDPYVVWKDGEFSVVEKVTKKDKIFPITLIKKEAIELTEDMIKTPADIAEVRARRVNMGAITGKNTNTGESVSNQPKKIKANFVGEA
jgi:hypothetical protein